MSRFQAWVDHSRSFVLRKASTASATATTPAAACTSRPFVDQDGAERKRRSERAKRGHDRWRTIARLQNQAAWLAAVAAAPFGGLAGHRRAQRCARGKTMQRRLPARGAQTLVVLTGALLQASLTLLPAAPSRPVASAAIAIGAAAWALSLALVVSFLRGWKRQKLVYQLALGPAATCYRHKSQR